MEQDLQSFWSNSTTELLNKLQVKVSGLTSAEANQRLKDYGANRLKPQKRSDAFTLLVSQFKSPIILILLFATGLSIFLHNLVDASIILIIVIISGLLGFWQEYSASNAVAKLLAIVQINTKVLRNGKQEDVHIE